MRNDDEFGPKENTFTIILFLAIILLIVCFINDRENIVRIYQPQTGELINTCQFANEHLNAEASKKFKAGNHTHIDDGVFVQTVKEQDGVIYCSEPVGSSQH